MSLGIVVKAPEGLVLAAESRVTLQATPPGSPPLHVNFDNATKLLSPAEPHNHVGAVTYGQAAIQLRTAQSFLPEFEAALPDTRCSVEEFATHLRDFYMAQWQAGMPSNYQGPDMAFVVGGYNPDEPYGRVFLLNIPSNPDPVEQHSGMDNFGVTWGGQREYVDRIVQGFDARLPDIVSKSLNADAAQMGALMGQLQQLQIPIPLQAMPLQDCVDLAIFFIRTTIAAQGLTVGIRGVGGPIDVAVVTRREGLRYIQQKRLVGERGDLTARRFPR